ncbi:YbaN family protein [Stenotrophomonas sp. ISL-67]|uniref:YbaN family protein n=1 Tax=Stenotrophomonas sp. ISL-67 TaxID=2819171 RepID=UPI001BE95EAE|nr:YbaN family protein [Stenotrophomonas sp. ISL-67]MBT2767010.1 YbaN family protein [Stenotrophomonas sp. ISL-67]
MNLPERPELSDAPLARPRVRFRWAWWLLAYASLGTGIVGIFVPGLPTTVFILISAWAASRGSERLHNWLLRHPRFGPAIANWQAHGAVSRKGKWMATLTMAVCAGIMLWCVPVAWVKWLSIGCMAVVAVWLWSRPLPPEHQPR